MKKEEDFALWNQFLEGDEKAYLYIYKLYAQDMYSYGMLFTTNSELVKDCLHDVFIKIHRNRKKLSQVDNIRLYLLKAMKNYLFDVFDKKKELFHNDTIEPVFSPEYTIEDNNPPGRTTLSIKKNPSNVRITDSTSKRSSILQIYEKSDLRRNW